MNWTEYGTLIVIVFLLHVAVFLWLRKKPRKSIIGKHVLVTGGSSGIGLWVAIHAAKLGAHVTIVARNVLLLEKAQRIISAHRLHESQMINIKAIDLTSDFESIAKLLSDTENASGDIYMLVNCAGLAICGTIEDTTAEDARHMMNVNFFGTFHPVKYVLTKMKCHGDGIIVITASQAALLGIYGYGAYGSSKFALRGLAECVAMETRHRGISVTLALPADTDTPGLKTENKTKPLITQIISGSGGLAQPEHVAKQLLDDALNGNFYSISGLESWMVTILCSGLAPWGGVGMTILSALVLGPLRIIGAGIQWNFQRIVASNAGKPKVD